MIRCKTIQDFTYMPLSRFEEIKKIQRVRRNTPGKLYTGDKFECSKEIAEYLSGKNSENKKVIKIIEVCPDDSIFKKQK